VGLTERGAGRHLASEYERIQTVLERCGHRPQVLFSRPSSKTAARFGYALGNGLLAWEDAKSLHVRRLPQTVMNGAGSCPAPVRSRWRATWSFSPSRHA